MTTEAVVITADRAIVPEGARGPTAVLALGGAIALVGDPAAVLADPRAAGAVHIDWSHRAMVPGTVNTHNHSFQSLLRGIGDDLPFLTWRDRALYRYSPRLDATGMGTAALFAFGEMLLHGVTTVCDFYYLNAQGNDHASATIEAARRLGMRIVLARCFYDWDGAPASYRETIPQAVAHFEQLHARYHDRARHLVSVQPAPHSQHGATPDMIVAGAGCARDAGVPWHIHLAEERYQVDQSLARFGARPLHAIGALPVDMGNMIAVHGCWFDASERALLAERGGSLAYCPGSNMFLGDGVTDLVDLCARGVRVGLGTDGGCSNNRVSVFDEMRMAALLQKVHKTDGQAIDAETCFALGTRTAGAVLRLPIGAIAAGYRCDLVALDLDDPSLWPAQALEKNVVYALSPRAITDVVVDGQEVVTARQLRHVELHEIQVRVAELTADWIRDYAADAKSIADPEATVDEDENDDDDEDDDGEDDAVAERDAKPFTPLEIELEISRQRSITWLIAGTALGILLITKLGTVGVWGGILLCVISALHGLNLVQTLMYEPGTIKVSADTVQLPRGLCRPRPLKLAPGDVTAAYFLRRSVPWNKSSPVLIVEVGPRAMVFPRDWFASEADQRHVIHALLRGRKKPAA